MVTINRQAFQGGCRCGLFTYESQLSEKQAGFKCNCSLCVKKGYLWVFPGQDNFKVISGTEEQLTTYKFGPKKLSHKFCPKCGGSIYAFTKGDEPEYDLALNVHAIYDFDPSGLERTDYDGASIGGAYKEPVHKGETPSGTLRSDKIYTGSCHCGALTIASNVRLEAPKPTNCSCKCDACTARGCIWLSPKKDQTFLGGNAANIAQYPTPGHTLIFCNTCGVTVAETIANEGGGLGAIYAVNARVLHGLDKHTQDQLGL